MEYIECVIYYTLYTYIYTHIRIAYIIIYIYIFLHIYLYYTHMKYMEHMETRWNLYICGSLIWTLYGNSLAKQSNGTHTFENMDDI